MNKVFLEDFQQIGGKYAISWKTASIFFPIFVIGIPFLESNYQDFENFKLWTYSSLLGIIPCIIAFYIADKTYFADRVAKPRRPADVFLLGLIIGLIKGLSLEFFAFQFNLPDGDFTEMLLIRGVNSGLLGAAFMPFISLVSVVTERVARERRSLIEELSFIATQTSHQAEITYLIEHETLEKLNNDLQDVLESTKIRFVSALRDPQKMDPETLSALLAHSSEELVRPLSHTLYKKGEEDLAKFRFLPTLKFASTHFDFDFKVVTLLFALSSLKELVLTFGLEKGIQVLCARAALVCVTLFLAQSLFEKVRSRNSHLFAPFAIVAVAFYLVLENRMDVLLNFSIDLGKIAIEGIWLATLILLVTFVKSAAQSTNIELENGRLYISQSDLLTHNRSLAERQNYKNYSKFLHGVLHSRLNACAMAISLAHASGDKSRTEFEVKRALETLNLKLEVEMVHKPKDINSEVSLIIAKWDGLMEISVNEFIFETVSDFQLYGVSQVLDEALSNAFRHGRATSLCVHFQKQDDGVISLTISDNGVGVISSTPGLGSAYFTEVAGKAWQLQTRSDGSGAELKLMIPERETRG